MNSENKNTDAGHEASDVEFTAEQFEALNGLALSFCELLIVCAPPFAAGSHGGKVVADAIAVRPHLLDWASRCAARRDKVAATPLQTDKEEGKKQNEKRH